MIIQIQKQLPEPRIQPAEQPTSADPQATAKEKTFSHTTLLTPAKKFQRKKHQERSTYMLTWAYDTDFPVASLTGTDHIF